MTEQDFLIAVDAVVARWRHDRTGEPLTCLAFKEALPSQCHANAAAYVAQHGGEVVRGFLVQHPPGWTMVWVMPHSVVRTDLGFLDVTVKPMDLVGLAFFPIEGDPIEFTEWAKKFPQESRSIASTL